MELEELLGKIDEAIANLATEAGDTNQPVQYCEQYASAARQLAEARAWIVRPGQSHGGSQSST